MQVCIDAGMSDSLGGEVGYGVFQLDPNLTALSPEPDQGSRDPITIRAPGELLQQARAAAEAETLALQLQGRKGEVTLNGMLVHALKTFFDAYEKANGQLPAPSPVPKKKKRGEKAAKDEHSPEIEKYAAGIAKKRQGREN